MNSFLKKVALSFVAASMLTGQVRCENVKKNKKEESGYTIGGVVSKGFSIAKTIAGTVRGAGLVYALPANMVSKQAVEDRLSDDKIQDFFAECNENAKKLGSTPMPNTPEKIAQFKQQVLMLGKIQVGTGAVFAAIGAYVLYRTWAPEPAEEA